MYQEAANIIVPWILGVVTVGVVALVKNAFFVNGRLVGVEKDLEWIVRALGSKAGKTLHSPHTPDLDLLIEKFENGDTMLWSEIAHFAVMLKHIEEDLTVPKGDRLAAGILLVALEKTYGDLNKIEDAPATRITSLLTPPPVIPNGGNSEKELVDKTGKS